MDGWVAATYPALTKASRGCTARWGRLLPGTFSRSPKSASSSWTDSSGHLWLFGGLWLTTIAASASAINDLWEFDTSKNEWAWMGGSNTVPGTNDEPARSVWHVGRSC